MRLGLDRNAFELFEGTDFFGGGSPAQELLENRVMLMQYDIVFMNCGADIADPLDTDMVLDDPRVRENLRAFVDGGGRFFATDRAYDAVEAFAPAYVDFMGGANGLTASREPRAAAEVGIGEERATGRVLDTQLRDWLGEIGALQGVDMIPIQGFLSDWAVIDETNAMGGAKVWIEGEVPWYEGAAMTERRGVQPLTVTFEIGCGRTLFSSYHTVEGFEGGGSRLTPQEDVLAYLVLEIGACIENVVDPIF